MGYFRRILLLPVGSFEYHGEHLPSETDTIIAATVGSALEAHLKTVFSGETRLLPVLAYGVSLEHVGLPGVGTVHYTTYFRFLQELLSSISVERDLIVIVNGHGGNTHSIATVEADFNYRNGDRKVFSPPLYPSVIKDLCERLFGEFDTHAGSVETSLLAFYGRADPGTFEIPVPNFIRGALRFFRTVEVASHGVIKKLPTVTSDPDLGRKVHELIVTEMAETILKLINDLSLEMTEK